MNYTLKQDLKTLAMFRGDPGLPAFRALFRRRAGERAPEVEQSLRNMILTMPETLERVRMQTTRPGMPKNAHRLHGHLLAYLYESRDIIPEDGNGFFGYVDDAYLIAAAHHRTSGRHEPEVNGWLDAMVTVLPVEAAQLDALLDRLLGERAGAGETAVASA